MCVYLCRAVVYIVEIDRKTRHTTFGVRDEGVLSDTKFHLHSLLLYLLHISLFNKHTNKYEPEIKIKIKKKNRKETNTEYTKKGKPTKRSWRDTSIIATESLFIVVLNTDICWCILFFYIKISSHVFFSICSRKSFLFAFIYINMFVFVVTFFSLSYNIYTRPFRIQHREISVFTH